jgi:hypothetical protein
MSTTLQPETAASAEATDSTLVQSSVSATINAPIEKVDIPTWCLTLPDAEYQACSPAHVAAGATTSPDSEAHNRQEAPLFAKSIERHALRATS